MPFTRNSAAGDVGFSLAIPRSDLSSKIVQAGLPRASATRRRQARSRSKRSRSTSFQSSTSAFAAFALPEHQGKGAIRVEGRMAELLHLVQAESLVAVAAAIAEAAAA